MRATVRKMLAGILLFSLASACSTGNEVAATPSGPATPSLPSNTPSDDVQNFSLVIHCGIRYALFEGVNWEALPPIPSIPGYITDPKTGVATNRYEIKGVMVRTSETEAQFTTTDPPAGVVVRFTRSTATAKQCA